MIGYVDAILERQDRADVLKKMETFQMEGVSRKIFRELTEHYKKLDQATQEKISKQAALADMTKKRVDQADASIKKLQTAVAEINNINKKMQLLVSALVFDWVTDRDVGIKSRPDRRQQRQEVRIHQ